MSSAVNKKPAKNKTSDLVKTGEQRSMSTKVLPEPKTGFLSLPLELRRMVYDEFFEVHAPRFIPGDGEYKASTRLNLLLTCRQIKIECQQLAFKSTVFYINSLHDFPPIHDVYVEKDTRAAMRRCIVLRKNMVPWNERGVEHLQFVTRVAMNVNMLPTFFKVGNTFNFAAKMPNVAHISIDAGLAPDYRFSRVGFQTILTTRTFVGAGGIICAAWRFHRLQTIALLYPQDWWRRVDELEILRQRRMMLSDLVKLIATYKIHLNKLFTYEEVADHVRDCASIKIAENGDDVRVRISSRAKEHNWRGEWEEDWGPYKDVRVSFNGKERGVFEKSREGGNKEWRQKLAELLRGA